MSEKVTIWHYPRCSKSRQTMEILEGEELDIDERRYLDDPPDADTLADVVDRLGIEPRQLVRTKESLYRELDVDEDSYTDRDWLELMAEYPKLIQRPVVLTDAGAAIGRPPEAVREIL